MAGRKAVQHPGVVPIEKVADATELPKHLTVFVFQPQIHLGNHKNDGNCDTVIDQLRQQVPQNTLVNKGKICAYLFAMDCCLSKVVI